VDAASKSRRRSWNEHLSSELPFRIAINLVTSAYFGPAPVEEALLVRERAFDLVRDSVVAQVFFNSILAAFLAMQGDAEASRTAGSEADRLASELGMPQLTATVQVRGEAERFLGRPDLAEGHFRRAVEHWDAVGETGFNSTTTALLASALCDLERFDEAETYAARSREMSSEDDFASQSAWSMAQARVLSHRGEHEGALSIAEQAVAILEATDYLAWQGEGHEVRGMVLAAAGRTKEARSAYERSIDRFERKGVVTAVERVRAAPAGG